MDELFARLPIRGELTPSVARLLRVGIPLAAAVTFLVLWTIAESGRTPLAPKLVMFALYALAIGLAGVMPRLALAVIAAVPVGLLALGLVVTVLTPLAETYAGYFFSWAGWGIDLSTSWPAWFAVPVVVGYVAMTNERRRMRVASLLAGVASAVVYSVVLVLSGWLSWTSAIGNGFGSMLSSCVVFVAALVAAVAAAWLIGIGLAALRRVEVVTDRLETTTAKLDDADLELRLAHDRGRISRDIHDSLAHSLAIVVAQAEGASAIHEVDPDASRESLGNIATVAREALGEVRRLVERINDEDDVSEHRSRIEHIPALVDDVRAAGIDVTLRVLGDLAPLALSKQVAAYRIVQESLTNALKHAGRGATVTVTLDAQGAGLAVLVVSTCTGGSPLVTGATRGIGIAGMKERARLVGGWLTALPSDDDTFVVTAFIPPDSTALIAPDASPLQAIEVRHD
ncbi:sensor histidine kinase [Rathayibacter sp. KR2-224]|uniref:sensor histidine kinase n=1 Tax=Rathayibacter sp. KR2-224 TaxID=3400913 RepID=UPI003C06E7D7